MTETWQALGDPYRTGGKVTRICAGWPMPGLEYDRWQPDILSGEVIWTGWLMLPGILPGRLYPFVPIHPVLPGFLLNTLVYAMPVLLIGWGVAAIRHRRRRPHVPAAGP